jgi:hypothetical protein
MDSSYTALKHEKEDDKSSSVDLKIFDTEDSDPDDCCHHIEKVSISI